MAGALQFLPPGEAPRSEEGPFTSRLLNDADLWRLLETLPRRPLLAGEEGLRLSLAGAQSKVPIVVAGGRIALPAPGQPTTHILKPPIPRFPATTGNEAFAKRLAAAAGLDVAPIEARRVELPDGSTRTFLLVTRYDRRLEGEGHIRRLHQEDFCQALCIPAERKYQAEGGPGLGDCFRQLRRVSTRPAADVLKPLDAVIFNAALGNTDAHAKNFSPLIGPHGATLAPVYDLHATVRYPELSPKFAMKIGRAATLETLGAEDWTTFADQAELGHPLVQRRVRDLGTRITKALGPARESLRHRGLDEDALDGMRELVAGRLAWLRNGRAPSVQVWAIEYLAKYCLLRCALRQY